MANIVNTLLVIVLGVWMHQCYGSRSHNFGFGYELPNCPVAVRSNVTDCFATAHGSVWPCLKELFQNPNYRTCKDLIAKTEGGSQSYMPLSKKWHTTFVKCMGVDVGNDPSLHARQTRSSDDKSANELCFEEVRERLRNCEEYAITVCPKYEECKKLSEADRLATNYVQKHNGKVLRACLADPTAFAIDHNIDENIITQ